MFTTDSIVLSLSTCQVRSGNHAPRIRRGPGPATKAMRQTHVYEEEGILVNPPLIYVTHALERDRHHGTR